MKVPRRREDPAGSRLLCRTWVAESVALYRGMYVCMHVYMYTDVYRICNWDQLMTYIRTSSHTYIPDAHSKFGYFKVYLRSTHNIYTYIHPHIHTWYLVEVWMFRNLDICMYTGYVVTVLEKFKAAMARDIHIYIHTYIHAHRIRNQSLNKFKAAMARDIHIYIHTYIHAHRIRYIHTYIHTCMHTGYEIRV